MDPDEVIGETGILPTPENAVAFDTETWAFEDGVAAPPLVCASVATAHGASLLDKTEALDIFRLLLDSPDLVLVLANAPFDMLVMAVHAARRGINIVPKICAAYRAGRVFDVLAAEKLRAIAEGTESRDPFTGGMNFDARGAVTNGYSLWTVNRLVTGRTDAKENDEWRARYRELDPDEGGPPMDEWPEVARVYPVDDARNTRVIALAQCGHLPKRARHDRRQSDRCARCGDLPGATIHADAPDSDCRILEPHLNLWNQAAQARAHLAMWVGAAWGPGRTDLGMIEALENRVRGERLESLPKFVALGYIREDGSKDLGAVKRAVAVAYGAASPCRVCDGTAKVRSPKAKDVRCSDCKGQGCAGCDGIGRRPDPKHLINCKECAATGFDLDAAPAIPRTPKDGVSYGADALEESGSEDLMGLADYDDDAKTESLYCKLARRCVGKPLVYRVNPILESGRAAIGDGLHSLPRKGDVRELWGPYLDVMSSTDIDSGELVTHAQNCLWTVGESLLADALNKGAKPHSILGAQMTGRDYDAFQAALKIAERDVVDARQAAKPGNFGFPGGMGAWKLVLQQRKQGPDTPCPNGPVWVELDDGTVVKGYRGLRFCILMDGAAACGVEKITELKTGNHIAEGPPTCKACILCAARLKGHWLESWPENRAYFRQVNAWVEGGQDRFWGPAIDLPTLGPGQVYQHVSGRIRGGLDYCALANGFFQGLLADAAKEALWLAQMECVDDTVRVVTRPGTGQVASAYEGGPSPLVGSRIVLFAHDELIGDHPGPEAHDAATRIGEIMEECLKAYCPDMTRAVSAKPALMKRWYKDAKTIRDERGRLLPWAPKPKAARVVA